MGVCGKESLNDDESRLSDVRAYAQIRRCTQIQRETQRRMQATIEGEEGKRIGSMEVPVEVPVVCNTGGE